jgi:AhpD family alkylhydroperoxidase
MSEERTLTKKVKEQVAFVVSGINLYSLCLAAHLETSRNFAIHVSP